MKTFIQIVVIFCILYSVILVANQRWLEAIYMMTLAIYNRMSLDDKK